MAINQPKHPVLFLAYANERTQQGYLSQLMLEMKSVMRAMEPRVQEDRIHLRITPAATQLDIQEVFQDPWYDGRVRVFHYSGHSDAQELWLEDASGGNRPFFSLGLAKFLGAQKGLHLVFLNGCANDEHADLLREAGVPVAIVTSEKIKDDQAKVFAEVFYQGLAGGATIQEAFQEAEGMVLGQFGLLAVEQTQASRGLFWREPDHKVPGKKIFPWRLITSGENDWFPLHWRLFQRPEEMGDWVSISAQQLVGESIDNYELLEVLGEGASGLVFKARHKQLNDIRALKLSHPIEEGFERLRAILASGYKGMQAIQSPVLAKVYDIGSVDFSGGPRMYIVMELVQGTRLDKLDLRKEMLEMASAAPLTEIGIQLARALSIAHQTPFVDENGLSRTGLLHGNLKTRKIIVQPDGAAKLIDFNFTDMTRAPGVKIQIPATSQIKDQSEDLATYFPPEVLSGQSVVNVQTDIYSLGALLVKAATAAEINDLNPVNPEQLHHFLEQKGVKIPKKLAQTLFLATHPNPRIRYKQMADMLRDLEKSTFWLERLLYRFRRRK